MDVFKFRQNWPDRKRKMETSIDKFVVDLENLQHVHEIEQDAALDARLGQIFSSSRKNIADVVHAEIKTNGDRSPRDIFESAKSRLKGATEAEDKVFEAVGSLVEGVSSVVSKVGEQDAAGVASEVYKVGNGLRQLLRNDAKLGPEVASALKAYYSAQAQRSARAVLATFHDTANGLIVDALAYRDHFKNAQLEKTVTGSVPKTVMQNHNHHVEGAAEKAVNAIYDHFHKANHPLLPLIQLAAFNASVIERTKPEPFHLLQKAGYLAIRHPEFVKIDTLTDRFVEQLLPKELKATKGQFSRDIAALNIAVLEMSVPQMHADMVARRYGANDTQATNVTVLFEEQRFQSDIKDVLSANGNKPRGAPPQDQRMVEIRNLQEELALSKSMIIREGLRDPRLGRACHDDLQTISAIEGLLKDVPEKVQHVAISWGRAPDRRYFDRLKDEVKESLEVALSVHAENLESRKATLQEAMRRSMRGEKPEVTTTRRLDG